MAKSALYAVGIAFCSVLIEFGWADANSDTGSVTPLRARVLVLNAKDRGTLNSEKNYDLVTTMLSSFGKVTVIDQDDPIVRRHLGNSLPISPDSVEAIADSCKATQLLWVTLDTFEQHGLAPELHSWFGFFYTWWRTSRAQNDLEAFPDSVQTTISAFLRRVDLAAPKKHMPKKFEKIVTVYQKGNAAESAKEALKQHKESMRIALKELFNFDMAIVHYSGNSLDVEGGKTLGLRRATLLKIVRGEGNDTSLQYGAWSSDGRKTIGIARVHTVNEQDAICRIIRLKTAIRPTDKVIEQLGSAGEVILYTQGNPSNKRLNVGASILFAFRYPFLGGITGNYQRLLDSRGNWENGFEFGGLVDYKMVDEGPLTLDLGCGALLGFNGCKDDSGRSVSAFQASIAPRVIVGYEITRWADLVVSAGYRAGAMPSGYQQTTTDESGSTNLTEKRAFWKDAGPKLPLSGMEISAGIRFPLF